MEFSKLGVAFVDEDIPGHKQIEAKIAEKEEELIEEAKEKLNIWLNAQGLEIIMGIVVQVESKSERRF